jgi:hypothetical protein
MIYEIKSLNIESGLKGSCSFDCAVNSQINAIIYFVEYDLHQKIFNDTDMLLCQNVKNILKFNKKCKTHLFNIYMQKTQW